jgi:energy-converting hydrogenase Eha subunit F
MLSPTNNIRPKNHHFGLWAVVIVWLVTVGLLIANGQRLMDWWRLRGYVAPAAVVQMANEDTMKPYTRHLFYLNRPQLLPTVKSFRAHCPENENTVVLGCYHPDQDGIFIYNVSDPTLAGVQQVTAAHEVLHAVYARLSSSARSNLDNELNNYYKHGLSNQLVKAEVKLYQQTEPGSVMDEMSCTFGTEIANLPAPLEAYYNQYFSNRAAIVGYEQQYEGAFSTRQATITQDDAQLTQLRAQINSLEAQLKASTASLAAQLASLTSLRSQGSIAAYNAGVPPYNTAIDNYNASVQTLSNLVSQYNQLAATRNQVAGALTTLVAALDTRVTPVQQPTQ